MDDLDARICAARDRTRALLRALDVAIGDLSVERLADVLPTATPVVEQLVARLRAHGVRVGDQ